MLSVREIIARIERLAPPRLQEEWDACGVQVAGDRDDASRLALTLDPSPACIAAALDWNADVVLCHHPLALTPKLPAKRDAFRETLRLLLSSGAWLYAAHTSLDSVTAGPVSWLGQELGLSGLAPLAPSAADPACGIGFLGDLPAPLPLRDFLARLEGLLGRDFWTQCGPEPETVRRVACCPGSGASLMERAASLGADVLVTGDVRYHQAAEAPLLVIDAGHFRLEEEMMRRLAVQLSDDLSPHGVDVRFFEGHEPFTARVRGG